MKPSLLLLLSFAAELAFLARVALVAAARRTCVAKTQHPDSADSVDCRLSVGTMLELTFDDLKKRIETYIFILG